MAQVESESLSLRLPASLRAAYLERRAQSAWSNTEFFAHLIALYDKSLQQAPLPEDLALFRQSLLGQIAVMTHVVDAQLSVLAARRLAETQCSKVKDGDIFAAQQALLKNDP